ncbi:peptidase S45 penicillin amidase [Acidimicrobium ferrooxidans DSM 10331]|uniref:Peptidase S45 penicillin amidase n=1 Tax=Acidimicrobium ferrooxidans (strain DSM 10331 / JCM 15462 / NBRC 103882 / ICP) TaxID=525909 RepID=C7LXV8_ACIFD|nr:penicillin acylase family protein [Acidimicrobium ferrooxidans]ACU53566.1 peptidase S45 penicillin amidase [Acidimicrobium ferrooxidans DSM 10331]
MRIGRVVAAAVVLAGVVGIEAVGVAGVPALGSVLDPSTGVLALATRAGMPTSASFQMAVPGTARIGFTSTGFIGVSATSDASLWYAMGYAEGRTRLFEMDLLRREAGGTLAALLGHTYLASDEFQLRLGVRAAAEANLAALPPADRAILDEFTAGVNAARSWEIAHHALSTPYLLLGTTPAPWQPVDSMLVQEFLAEELDYTQQPVDLTRAVARLGLARVKALFPTLAADPQSPFDTGPYPASGITPLDPPVPVSHQLTSALGSIERAWSGVPAWARHQAGDSNNWAIAATHTTTGAPILAGDPHLPQTLPSIWLWLSANAPGYHFAGVAAPGLPIVLIGRTPTTAWSLTDAETQATYFYRMTTSPSHPGAYRFDGTWRPYTYRHYTIAIHGGQPVTITVPVTVDGPVISLRGTPVAVDWLGDQVSLDFPALLKAIKAQTLGEFEQALRGWKAPAQNFAFADAQGQIGIIAAGEYLQFRRAIPWLVMNGNGTEQPIGAIPFDAVPESNNPARGFVFSANQRPVGPGYPYYLGTSADFYANGFRADEIAHVLSTTPHLGVRAVEHLQTSVTDYLATQLVPWIVHHAHAAPGTSAAAALHLLASWNDQMGASSQAASVWWTWLGYDIRDLFGPLWRSARLDQPTGSILVINQLNDPLLEDLQAIDTGTMTPTAIATPGDPHPSPSAIATAALAQTATWLTSHLGSVGHWQWRRIHRREFPSLTGVASLAYGPRGSSGDAWTVNAADGGLLSEQGPSWRMIVAFGRASLGILPGGESENPLSAWYENLIPLWWNGRYLSFTTASLTHPIATWTLVGLR